MNHVMVVYERQEFALELEEVQILKVTVDIDYTEIDNMRPFFYFKECKMTKVD